MSASHIYHSALPLSPQTSVVRKLYGQYAHPLTRIVQGVPMSWDPSIATIKCSRPIEYTVWSPCSRFIAISLEDIVGIQILDAVTLKRLKFFTPPHYHTQLFTFSPKSHLLTWLGGEPEVFTSWNLQTGVQVSKISIGDISAPAALSITYSGCGTMFGVLFKDDDTAIIGTYNVSSITPTYYHSIEGSATYEIWTHGECLQFITLGPELLTIWEVGFTSKHPPTKVRSLPTPQNFDSSEEYLFLPTLSQLAFIFNETVFIWGTQHSKLLLNSVDIKRPREMTFSPDGHFFACGADGQEIYLWKKSPTGYNLHQKLIPSRMVSCKPLLSPNGQSIVMSSDSTLQLWHTTDPTTSPSSVPTQTLQSTGYFILRFSLDQSLAVTARLDGNMVTVLDLKSGIPQLIIETGIKICDLGITADTIIVVGEKEVITWNLPAGKHIVNARANINDSIKTTVYHCPAPLKSLSGYSALISPDFNYIVVAGDIVRAGEVARADVGLNIYDASTGEHLADTFTKGGTPWFSTDGHEIWCDNTGLCEGWAITRDSESNVTKLEHLDPTESPSGGFHGQSSGESSSGYQVTDDGWVLDFSGKQLLWLPHGWRSSKRLRIWDGQFLAFLHRELPEVVILELPEE